jgi:hypothetical protein
VRDRRHARRIEGVSREAQSRVPGTVDKGNIT